MPVRGGYRIIDNDKDGYLEDGIIVKTKGTGYIDPKYRKKYLKQRQQLYNNQQPDMSLIGQASRFVEFNQNNNNNNFRPISSSMIMTSASSYSPRYFYPKKYLKSEIIYGRRGKYKVFMVEKERF